MLASSVVDTPVGPLTVVASDDGVRAILWDGDDPTRVTLGDVAPTEGHPILTQAAAELAEYFMGTRTRFDVPVDVVGTEFQQRVWNELRKIPYGSTTTYGAIAVDLGNPDASRAVGAANGRNPVSIIVPCHRVVGSAGDLTGFAGGIERKAALLDLERGVGTLF